jgi:hypothetical protein
MEPPMTPNHRLTADHLAIIEVINRYGAALDARDWPRLQTCFTARAVVNFGATRLEGPEVMVRFIEEATAGLRWQQHLLGSHDVAVEGDSATASTQLIATQVSGGDPDQALITVGTYRDVLVRTASGWRIEERTEQVGWRETRVQQGAAVRP